MIQVIVPARHGPCRAAVMPVRADFVRMRFRPLLAWSGGTPRRRALATGAAMVTVFGVGVLDSLTGSSLSFAVFYVLVVVGITVVAGRGVAIVTALWSSVVWGIADAVTLRAETPGVHAWNGAARFVVHAIVVLLMAALLRALRAAQESEARSRAFLASAAHQLRTPVAALGASVEALLLEGASPAQERMLANVAAESSRLGRLVASLLRAARLDQGESLRLVEVDITALFEEELDRVRQRSNLEWRLIVEPDSPRRVVIDAEATRESLGNVLDNARRHAASTVEITFRGEQGQVVVEILDDGPGLPSGAEAKAFERFVTLDGQGGTGLGLAIARELARHQGGDLVYDRKAFVLTLPLRKPAMAASDVASSSRGAARTGPSTR